MKQVYRITKTVTCSTKARSGTIKAKGGSLISKGEDKLERWAEHFKEVLNRLASNTPAQTDNSQNVRPIDTEEFTEDEVRKAIATLKTNKSPGMDRITAEMMKAGSETIVQWVCGICNQIWESGIVHVDREDGIVVCIPKKGNLSECDNWRGVTLLSIPGKVYCQMILNRMRDMVDGELQEELADFRPKCSCAEQIFTLKRIVEK